MTINGQNIDQAIIDDPLGHDDYVHCSLCGSRLLFCSFDFTTEEGVLSEFCSIECMQAHFNEFGLYN